MTRVLIVDDRPENLYLLRVLFTGHGFEVDEARNGAEALVKARQVPPDLVVSDLLMPVMDGFTLLRHWKIDDRLKPIPFVVYTATYTEPTDERLALDLGADAFILKPTEPEPFVARLREVLLGAERHRLPAPRAPQGDDDARLGQYSQVLVRKLEEKVIQLQEANRRLEQHIAERESAEAKAAEQIEELRRWHQATLGREDRILQLKGEINELLAKAGQPPRYPSAAEGD